MDTAAEVIKLPIIEMISLSGVLPNTVKNIFRTNSFNYMGYFEYNKNGYDYVISNPPYGG